MATTLHDLPTFKLTSWGNGVSYCLLNKAEHRDVFVSGDDASDFRTCLENLEHFNPHMHFNDILCRVWDLYGDAAQPVQD